MACNTGLRGNTDAAPVLLNQHASSNVKAKMRDLCLALARMGRHEHIAGKGFVEAERQS